MEGSPSGKLFRRWQRELSGGKGRLRRWGRTLRRAATVLLLLALLAAATVFGYRQFALRERLSPMFIAIAVGNFDHLSIPPIAFVADDARRLASLEEWRGIELQSSPAPGRRQIELELARIRNCDGPLVVYLAGRFMRHEAKICFLPADARLDDPRTCVPVEAIVDAIRSSRSNEKLLLIDVAGQWSAIEHGIYDEQITAELAALLSTAVNDDVTILISTSNDRREVLPALKRSVFAFCIERGLKGEADGWSSGERDGEVSVRELTEYVISQIENISAALGRRPQRPEIVSRGTDFVLARCNSKTPRITNLEGLGEYPPALSRAWAALRANVRGKKLLRFGYFVRRQTSLALGAEKAWKCGLPLDFIEKAWLAKFWELESWMASQPVREVAMPSVFARCPIPGAKSKQIIRTALAGGKSLAVGARETDRADAPSLAAAAVIELAQTGPLPAAAHRIADLLDEVGIENADFFEPLLLRELAAAGNHANRPPSLTRLLLETAVSGERVTAHLAAVPWVRSRLKIACASRHEGELCYWLGPFVSDDHVRRQLLIAKAQFDKALAECRIIEQSHQRLAYASWLLPFWLETSATSKLFPTWEQACATAEELYRQLTHKPESTGDLQAWIDNLHALDRRLAGGIQRLEAEFSSQRVRSLLLGEAGVKATSIDRAERLLRTPFLSPADRKKLTDFAAGIHRSLARVALASAGRSTPRSTVAAEDRPEKRPFAPVAWTLRMRGVISLFRLAGLDESAFEQVAAKVGQLEETAFGAEKRKLGRELARIWREATVDQHRRDPSAYYRDRLARFLPASGPVLLKSRKLSADGLRYREERLKEAVAFFAGCYRHRARDFRGCGASNRATKSFASFYRRVSQRLAEFAPPPAAASVRFASSENPVHLKKNQPVRTEVLLRVTSSDRRPAQNSWRVALLPQQTLEVTRTHATGTQPVADSAFRLPLLVKQTGSIRVPGKIGFVVRVEREGVSYHYVVPAEADVEKRLSAVLTDQVAPEQFVQQRIHLPPGTSGLGYNLLVRNDGATPTPCYAELRLDGKPIAAAGPRVVAPGKTQHLPLRPVGESSTTFLPGQKLEILLRPAKDAPATLGRVQVPIDIAHPSEYTAIKEVAYRCKPNPDGKLKGRWEVVVTRLYGRRAGARAAIETIAVPAVKRFDDSRGHGRWLTGGSPDLLLSLDSIAVDVRSPPAGSVAVNIDGVRWCYVFDTLFHSGKKSYFRMTPRRRREPLIQLPVPELWDASLPLPPTSEIRVANAPPESRLTYQLERISPAREELLRKTFPTPDRRTISLRLVDGTVHFQAAIENHPLELARIQREGTYRITAQLTDEIGVKLAGATLQIVVDGSPPGDLRFVGLPEEVAMGSPLAFSVSGYDPAGIERVEVAYVFQPRERRESLRRILQVRPDPADPESWLVTLDLPDKPGTARFILTMTDRFSRSSTIERKVTVYDPRPKPKPTILTGRVWIGNLPQPGVAVELSDSRGKLVARTITDASGRFTFRDLPAGRYQLSSRRRGSMRAGTAVVDVLPQRQATVDLRLSLLSGAQR